MRSYRDLPLRFSEFGTVYRFERSGVLHGLTRVRGFTQDDAHLFCTPEQLQGEFERTLDEALRLMKAFGFNEFQYVLSTRDAAARGETDALAEEAIRQALRRYELSYEIDEGGGAFYGPKLDVNVRDAHRPPVAAWYGAGRLRFAGALWAQVPRRRRPGPPAGHDSPGTCRLAGTFLRHSR